MATRGFKLFIRVAYIGALVIGLSQTGRAAVRPNFSGHYSLHGQKGSNGGSGDVTLDVVQSEKGIEVAKLEQGKKTINFYPLDGSDGDYRSPGGVAGRCKAQFKGKNLILESVVIAKPLPSATRARVHTKEQWQLSNDSKTLTIKSTVDFPDAPAEVSSLVGDPLAQTEKYIRSENP